MYNVVSMTQLDRSTQELSEIWEAYCSRMKEVQSEAVFNTWILSNPITKVVRPDVGPVVVTINSPTSFHSTNLQKNFSVHIKQVLESLFLQPCTLQFRVGEEKPETSSFAQTSQLISPISAPAAQQTNDFASTVATQHSPRYQSHNPPSPPQQLNPYNIQPASVRSPRVEELFSEQTMQNAAQDRLHAIIRAVGLRADYTFETFAVSTTNEMAHAAASAVS